MIPVREFFLMKKMKKYRQRGFTLIEVIVAFAILSLLVIMLNNIFTSASKTYQITDHRTDIHQNARAILDQISREVKHAIVYSDTGNDAYSFYIFKNGGGTWVGLGGGALSIEDELFFVAPWTVNTSQMSDLVEFGYYMNRGPDGGSTSYDNTIMRCAIPDRDSGGVKSEWNFMDEEKWGGDHNPLPDPQTYHELGFGIVDITIDWYGNTAAGLAEAWQTGTPFNPEANAYLQGKIPRAIRITLELIHEADARKYVADAGRMSGLTMTFSTVVYLNNCPGFE